MRNLVHNVLTLFIYEFKSTLFGFANKENQWALGMATSIIYCAHSVNINNQSCNFKYIMITFINKFNWSWCQLFLASFNIWCVKFQINIILSLCNSFDNSNSREFNGIFRDYDLNWQYWLKAVVYSNSIAN